MSGKEMDCIGMEAGRPGLAYLKLIVRRKVYPDRVGRGVDQIRRKPEFCSSEGG